MHILVAILLLVQAPVAPANPAPPPAVKEPVPPPAITEVKKAVKELKKTFKSEYGLRSPDDRKALADSLLKIGQEDQEDPAMQYALLKQAAELAAQAGDGLTVTLAIDELEFRFIVDGLKMKSDGLKDTVRYAKTIEAVKVLVDACLATETWQEYAHVGITHATTGTRTQERVGAIHAQL